MYEFGFVIGKMTPLMVVYFLDPQHFKSLLVQMYWAKVGIFQKIRSKNFFGLYFGFSYLKYLHKKSWLKKGFLHIFCTKLKNLDSSIPVKNFSVENKKILVKSKLQLFYSKHYTDY